MTLTDYQTAALRTAGDELPPLWYLALGLCGEAGEVANLVKKFERHGKPFDAAQVADELGDVLWYLAVAAKAAGLTLDEVASRNVAKLQARYPAGFVPAGGGADADRAAAARADHFVDAGKMVSGPVTTERLGDPGTTPRGFGIIYFQDRNDVECSLQESSSALDPCVWLGCNDADPKVLVPGRSWQPVQMPNGYVANTRMHLNETSVRALVNELQYWLENHCIRPAVAAPATTEQPELPALRPMDDGVRCGEWCTDGFDLKYTNGRWAATVEQLGADMFKATLFEAKFNPDSKIVSLSSWSLLGVQLAAEAWLRERHPFFDADWPGRHGNPPRVEVGAP